MIVRMARRALYADEVVLAALAQGIENGGTIADAAAYAGIGERTYSRWLTRGRTERDRLTAGEDAVEPNPVEAPFVEFVETMDRAKAGAKLGALACVRRAINGWDDVEVTVVEKEILYQGADGEDVVAVQTVTTTKRSHKFAWQAAMTWLERRYPDEFARLMRTELTGAEGTPLFGTAEELKARAIEMVDQVAEKRRMHEADAARAANGDG